MFQIGIINTPSAHNPRQARILPFYTMRSTTPHKRFDNLRARITNKFKRSEPRDDSIDPCTENSTTLCNVCVGLGLTIFDKLRRRTDIEETIPDSGILIGKFKSKRLYSSRGECRLCDILSKSIVRLRHEDEDEDGYAQMLELRAYSFVCHSGWFDMSDTNHVMLAEDRYLLVLVAEKKKHITWFDLDRHSRKVGQIVVQMPDESGGIIIPRKMATSFDTDLVKSWIQVGDSRDRSPRFDSPSSCIVNGLRFIDCQSRSIVQQSISTAPYVTLSYLWGSHLVNTTLHKTKTETTVLKIGLVLPAQ